MAGERLPGKLWAVTADGLEVQCQIDATLTLNVTLTEVAPCKPTALDTYKGGQWVRQTIESKNWQIAFSANAFADAVKMNNADFIEKILGDPTIQMEFHTTKTTDYDFDELQVFSGEGIISGYTGNGGGTGDGTYDVTITGQGEPSFLRTSVTP